MLKRLRQKPLRLSKFMSFILYFITTHFTFRKSMKEKGKELAKREKELDKLTKEAQNAK